MPRPPLNRISLSLRVDRDSANAFKAIAYALGYTYNGDGSPSQLVEAIAKGEVLVSKKDPKSP